MAKSENKNSVHSSQFTAHRPIPYGRQHITNEDIQAVVETLKSDYLTQGPMIAEFEQAFADYIGSKYAVAVANGTAALHLCTLALGVKPGDKVITTPITFSATANCVRYAGGDVVFADIDPETYLLDINKVENLLKNSPKGTYNGIIPVDFAGRAVNMEKYRELADEYGLWIIEDACHAPGGFFVDSKGEKQNCGNAWYADLAIFSFHPVKHIACGEGGMITTNDFEVYKKLNRQRSHGITKFDDAYLNSAEFATGVQGETEYPGWYMEMQELGYNYRITDFQAALGISQLARAEEGLQRRKEIASRYFDAFSDIPHITDRNLEAKSQHGHAYHLYVIEVKNRLELYKHLRANNIFAQIHYIPVHLMPYYREFGYIEGDLPAAENYYRHCISLPMYPTLSEEEQGYILSIINQFLA
jgi:UDP-4-amino-4,6-dideoxy-N-acetyl-beta-L-altrosamine transaminase